MLRALTTAATGMIAQQNKLDVISNNVANLSTYVYKKVRAEFQDLLSQIHRTQLYCSLFFGELFMHIHRTADS